MKTKKADAKSIKLNDLLDLLFRMRTLLIATAEADKEKGSVAAKGSAG